MKTKILIALSSLVLAGCMSPAGPLSSDVSHHVNIDGQDILVQRTFAGERSYAANKADPFVLSYSPEDLILNVRAIEKYTGCKVIRETIINQGGNTQAAVSCPAKK